MREGVEPAAPHAPCCSCSTRPSGRTRCRRRRSFSRIAGVTGLVVDARLDGTARGGVLVALAAERRLGFAPSASARAWTISRRSPRGFRRDAIAGSRASFGCPSPGPHDDPLPPRLRPCPTAPRTADPPARLARNEAADPVLFRERAPGAVPPFIGPLLPEAMGGEKAGIFVATAVFMVAILVSLAVSYALTQHLPIMAMVTTVIVVVFGGLTLVLHDETFIEIDPTIVYVMFAVLFFSGLWLTSRCSRSCSIRCSS